jgi:DNA-binding transcriptional ArsR family regulator
MLNMPSLNPSMQDTPDTLDISALRASAGEAAAMMKILANEDRLLLLCQLTQGELCVGELEALAGIAQPTLSQQLGVLRNEGLVSTRREGKHIYYRLGDARALAVLGTLHQLFCTTKGDML